MSEVDLYDEIVFQNAQNEYSYIQALKGPLFAWVSFPEKQCSSPIIFLGSCNTKLCFFIDFQLTFISQDVAKEECCVFHPFTESELNSLTMLSFCSTFNGKPYFNSDYLKRFIFHILGKIIEPNLSIVSPSTKESILEFDPSQREGAKKPISFNEMMETWPFGMDSMATLDLSQDEPKIINPSNDLAKDPLIKLNKKTLSKTRNANLVFDLGEGTNEKYDYRLQLAVWKECKTRFKAKKNIGYIPSDPLCLSVSDLALQCTGNSLQDICQRSLLTSIETISLENLLLLFASICELDFCQTLFVAIKYQFVIRMGDNGFPWYSVKRNLSESETMMLLDLCFENLILPLPFHGQVNYDFIDMYEYGLKQFWCLQDSDCQSCVGCLREKCRKRLLKKLEDKRLSCNLTFDILKALSKSHIERENTLCFQHMIKVAVQFTMHQLSEGGIDVGSSLWKRISEKYMQMTEEKREQEAEAEVDDMFFNDSDPSEEDLVNSNEEDEED